MMIENMAHWRTRAEKLLSRHMETATMTIIVLLLIFGFFSPSPAMNAENRRNTAEEEIWKLEDDYFTNLYKANYEKVLILVHPQFLG